MELGHGEEMWLTMYNTDMSEADVHQYVISFCSYASSLYKELHTPRLRRVKRLLQGCTVKNTASILVQQGSLWFRQASLLEAVGCTSDFLEQACLMDSLQVSVWTSSWLKSLPRVFPESPLAHTPDTDMELGKRRGMSEDMLTLAQLWGELQQPKLCLLDKPDTC